MGYGRLLSRCILEKRRLSRKALLCAIPASLVLLVATLSPEVVAQAALTRDEVLRLPAPLRASASDFGAVRCDASPVVGLLPGETPLSAKAEVVLAGATVVPARSFAQLSSGVRGGPISREGLGRLVTGVECLYRERGFVFARAATAVDPAVADRFTVTVTEGVVRRVEALAATESLARLALRAFDGVREGRPLDAGEVRRGLAHCASVGLTEVRPTIRRSRIDPASLDLVLIVTAPADQAFVQALNGNAKALGPIGVLAGTRFAGFTPLEERTTLGAYAVTDWPEQWSVQFDSEALLGGAGIKGRIGGAHARSRPGDVLAPLEIFARTTYLVAELSAPMSVRRGRVTSWRAGLEGVNQSAEFLGGLPLGDDRLRVGFLGFRVDSLLEKGLWQGELQFRRGLDVLGASRPDDPGLSRADSNPLSFVIRADGELGLQLSPATTLRASVRSQWTRHSLVAFERINFGGLSGGQGFDPGALSGDAGISASLQWLMRPIQTGSFGTVRPWVQLAGARLSTVNDGGLAAAEGASASVGFTWAPRGAWQIELAWAEPIGRIRGAGEDAFGSRLLLRVTGSLERSASGGGAATP